LNLPARKVFLKVDFLCGDFHWKKLWHLDPEPLYKFVTPALTQKDQFEHALSVNDSINLISREQSYV